MVSLITPSVLSAVCAWIVVPPAIKLYFEVREAV